jgi:hypothetical protein
VPCKSEPSHCFCFGWTKLSFVSSHSLLLQLRWAQYLCSLTYSVRLSLVEEFGDCGPDEDAIKNCEGVVTRVGADPDDTWWYWLVLVCLFVVFRFGALVSSLRVKCCCNMCYAP